MAVHKDAAYTHELLAYIEGLEYDAFMIEEAPGTRADLRNLLCVPRSRAEGFVGSHVLDLAVAPRSLQAVNRATIAEYAFPCCRKGGECCTALGSCCSFRQVHTFLNSQLAAGHNVRAQLL